MLELRGITGAAREEHVNPAFRVGVREGVLMLGFGLVALLSACNGSTSPSTSTRPPASVVTVEPSPAVWGTGGSPVLEGALPEPDVVPANDQVVQGYTEDGHAFWGAESAPVVITDFADFL